IVDLSIDTGSRGPRGKGGPGTPWAHRKGQGDLGEVWGQGAGARGLRGEDGGASRKPKAAERNRKDEALFHPWSPPSQRQSALSILRQKLLGGHERRTTSG